MTHTDQAAAIAACETKCFKAQMQIVRLSDALADALAALIYLRDCIETGKEPGMGIVHAAIRKAEGKS